MARKHRSKGTGSLFRKTPTGPWIAAWYGHDGKRREHSTRTTDKQAAARILTKLVADSALRRDLVIDPRTDRFAIDGRKTLAEHVAAYIAHCERIGLSGEHVASKERHLKQMAVVAGISQLCELSADALERYLSSIKDAGKSARTINFARQLAVAFAGWCVRTGRLERNPLLAVPTVDETRDRRRVRRPLTDNEVSRLLEVARERGRDAWYLAAALAGLRRGDMRRLVWSDVNFTENTLTLRHGKAKRIDTVPMHPQLADALRRRLEAFPAVPTARVWSVMVTNRTRMGDFLRAGIAKRVPVLNAKDEPVMVGEGENAKPKTRISVEDDEGRVIDLHALRTTLGTQLARAGVTPQVAQRVMRHSDYRTTLKHYTVLGLVDTAKAVAKLPGVKPVGGERQAATGTTDAAPMVGIDPQQYCQQLKGESGRESATQRVHSAGGRDRRENKNPQHSPGVLRFSAGKNEVERKGLEPSTPSLQS